MTTNQIIILCIMIGYLVLNVAIGMIMAKKQEAGSTMSKEKKYFIGSRGMNGLVLAMTTMATYTSVSSFVSGPGAAGMTYGYAQVWVAAVQFGAVFLVMGVLGNRLAISARKTGAVTIAGYLKARYKSDVLVIVTSLLMVAFFMAQMVSQFTGGATLIESVTGLPYWVSLVIFAVVVIAYTAFGGFTAVVITDTIQGLIMVLGTFLFIFFVLKAGGGLEGINEGMANNLPGVYDDLTAKYTPGALLSFWVLVGVGTIGLPQTAVRSMGFKSTKNLKSAMVIGTIVCVVVIGGMHLAGAWAGALLDFDNLPTSDYMIPMLVQKIMPTPIAGLFLAAPLAAVMSTVSSLLILASAAIIKDLYRTYIVKDNEVKIAKYNKNFSKLSFGATLIIGALVTIFTLEPPEIIFFLNLFAMGGMECAFFWPLVGGVFCKWGTKQGAVASSIGGTAVYIFCYYFVKVAGINAVVWGLLAGMILYFVVSKLTIGKGLDQDVLDKCF
ncbi:MAG: sodium/pantothenate symporter [Clostridiales bacterium]|nr:sodium/pantothenate symporter [Clostridiales bacterium]